MRKFLRWFIFPRDLELLTTVCLQHLEQCLGRVMRKCTQSDVFVVEWFENLVEKTLRSLRGEVVRNENCANDGLYDVRECLDQNQPLLRGRSLRVRALGGVVSTQYWPGGRSSFLARSYSASRFCFKVSAYTRILFARSNDSNMRCSCKPTSTQIAPSA